MLWCIAVCCSMLQCVAITVGCAKYCDNAAGIHVCRSLLQCVAACAPLFVAVCCSVLQHV